MSTTDRRILGGALTLALLFATTPTIAVAQDKPIKATDAWVRLPAAGETSTIAVASVENPGMYAIYLVTAASSVAGKVEFRDASKGPQPLADVTVINYETTYMDPKGIHMYLSDLKRPLKEGETIPITLTTDQGVKVEVSAVVKEEVKKE